MAADLADSPPVPDHVFHFSEDGGLRRFEPHVPVTNPTQRAAVWAIDEDHSPVYWFPRDCPRVSVWALDAAQQATLSERFHTDAPRLSAAETHRLAEIRTTRLFRYRLDGSDFEPWPEADGQYVTHHAVVPDDVEVFDDLLALHAGAGLELRLTPRLGRLVERIVASGLPFSGVRLRNALG